MTVDAHIGAWTENVIKQRFDDLPGMRSLVLYGGGVNDDCAEMLANCQNLRELHLVDTCVTDKGLVHIGKLRSLDWLVIDKANVTDRGLSNLADLNRLDGLQVIETKVGDEGFTVLLRLPCLSYLETSGQELKNKSLSLFSQLPSLISLRISCLTADDQDFLHFAFSRSIQNLAYDMPRVTENAVAEVLSRLPGCVIEPFTYYRPADKILYLASFCMEMYGLEEFSMARSAADHVMKWLPFNPAAHGTRAFINFRLGNYFDYRRDMENARNNADLYGEDEIFRMANYFLSLELSTVKNILEHEKPEQFVIERLMATSGTRMRELDPFQQMMRQAQKEFQEITDPVYRSEVFRSKQACLEAGLVLQPRPEALLLRKLREKANEGGVIQVPWEW